MSGAHGNENLAWSHNSQYLTVDGTSDTITLPVGTIAVTLYAIADCWIRIGKHGETPVAAAPSAEKVVAPSFFLPAATYVDRPVSESSDNSKVKIAAIQATAGGNLYVEHRSFS